MKNEEKIEMKKEKQKDYKGGQDIIKGKRKNKEWEESKDEKKEVRKRGK